MKQAIIVGAGLAGLTCARRLQELDWGVKVFEAGDAVGGRVRTDDIDGFRIDRGFQVLLTAYPAAKRWLDYPALELQEFPAGAVVWFGGGWEKVADPRREPGSVLRSLAADIGSFTDKIRVLRWAIQSRRGQAELDSSRPETTSLQALRDKGFSEDIINRFWRPWLSGIFLEAELETSSRMLEFVFGQFARGGTAIPRLGMQAIPEQLAAGLGDGVLELNQGVAAVSAQTVTLSDGSTQEADAVVVATAAGDADGLGAFEQPAVTWRESRTLYFDAAEFPVEDGMLRLNGVGDGVINHFVVLSQVSPALAPEGRHLIMAGVRPGVEMESSALEASARDQLQAWFGPEVKTWRLIKDHRVRKALPTRTPLVHLPAQPDSNGVWRAGDCTTDASIQGAMSSGERVAEAIADSGKRSG